MTEEASSSSPSFRVQAIQVVDQAKTDGDICISTGIGYLDHMIDQWNSHAQVGVGIEICTKNEDPSNDEKDADPNRFANHNQVELSTIVGTALGTELKAILSNISDTSATSTFSCPLDEALVTCSLFFNPQQQGSLVHYNLAPYGIYPQGTGRTKIGKLETFAIQSFWKALAESSHLNISLTKIRGDNAHHIVESSFKAFSRALRNYLDNSQQNDLWAPGSANDQASIALQRQGKVDRKTKETSISVKLQLNGCSRNTHVETGIPMLNAFYTTLAQEAHMTLNIHCDGDLHIDDHHTAEDVSIAVGQCLTQALGTKAGLNRMWVGTATLEEGIDDSATTIQVTMDLSNRPCFVHNLHDTLGQQEYVEEKADDEEFANNSLLTCEMLEHCLDSLVMNGHMTVHVVEEKNTSASEAASVADTVLTTAKAFGRALRVCAMVDQRRAGATASSKGTLSV
jgi:imidazoleglycerol-phosphate dehydratase